MDYSKLKYDPGTVSKNYQYMGDKCVVTGDTLQVIFPERWVAKELAELGEIVHLIGYFAVIDSKGNFGKMMVPAVVRTQPSRINRIVIDGDAYVKMEYDKGSNLIYSMNVVVDDNLVYYIYSEFSEKARIPFYFSYEERAILYKESVKYNGFALGYDPAALEYLAAFMHRNPDNIGESYRHRPNAKADLSKVKPAIMGLNDVTTGSNNFITKVTKSYTTAGITSALNNPAKRPERIETMLRNTLR